MAELPERLAYLEANYGNLDRRAAEHEKNDTERFERTFSFVKGMKTEILEAVGVVDSKISPLAGRVNELWDEKNKREGAFGLSKLVAGAGGGVIVALIEWAAKK